MNTTNNPETPIIRVEISRDGSEVIPSVLDSRFKVHYGLFSHRVERVGPITFGYSFWNGAITRIGMAYIHYGLFSNEITSVGHDPRVQIYVRARPGRVRRYRDEE